MRRQKAATAAEPQKLKQVLLGGCFLLSMILLLLYTSYVVSFSNSTLRSDQEPPPPPVPHRAEEKRKNPAERLPQNPFCDFSNSRNDYCEMEGDIRIHGNSSSILFVAAPSNPNSTELQQSWKLKPHPRKGDARAMARVTEMSVKSSSPRHAPRCGDDKHNSVPAILFSTGGYMGNFFHDFTDILIPIFTTSQQFKGEVQFMVSEILPQWNDKYRSILKPLTNYEIVDFNHDQRVRCRPRVIVGLKFHKDMSIDPSKPPHGLSMLDFGRFIRKSFELDRDTAIRLRPDQAKKKPRLLIIARKWTRIFANVDEIVGKAQELGFEVVVAKANYGLAEFAKIVNSCDVMLGVHGAGLTNLVFLPTHAVVIQVVPLGGLEGISWVDFGVPTVSLGMNYLQYTVSVDESTLTEQFARGDPVLSDQREAYKKHGWDKMIELYFAKQGVKLDMERFGSSLLHALELLRRQ
ncbi:alpha-1,3-arabinosyltransferase XAT3-like isoform X1 [Zingiber officinale]|uniref:Glycosyltransferase 61 catalytic domain-containing protein n=1 Tax=Zingiber officinale TaxID=94328 RepID=A0A8J5IG38_ZINOF|nr:alpha-1,3-arabinosyltransferase XAT3-like isoform X1 [Zingiber officinale]XP_042395864.1 alpha-1,3-arabinosyltransferase XAT3-like isoform X1 [Zingiber officinale]KAG6534406.1 hypothetical protein ZIOFF_008292 [Zingiber officinale]